MFPGAWVRAHLLEVPVRRSVLRRCGAIAAIVWRGYDAIRVSGESWGGRGTLDAVETRRERTRPMLAADAREAAVVALVAKPSTAPATG
jgi:hypothetical protein